ncbi:nitrate/nitrite transport system substrate-binding protein [Paraburkholderia caballeronis]|uniref:CmpA/NrtA family ABC transporter substrate-binding protein n=1 Tax=Paraburkholderia caballeronis TaxID=416943 RepID=UPI001064BFA7|nr:CmpA/NrtA family ABC transporter substrate-binding protein [Paraburkholderia caballeronis]TDV35720.1 nitrate/nitrite transport system substrate-binding protein [Paraburkholderia caballeronis]
MNSPALAPSGPTPELSHLRLGFVSLTDAAPLVVAKTLEFGHRHGLTLELCRQPSWAGIRDKLLWGEIDAAHALYGLVYGVQLGIGGPRADLSVLMVLNRNGQAITLSPRLADLIAAGHSVKDAFASLGRPPVLAQTFPTGTHAMWLYYWLAANGVHPLRDVKSVVLPPPDMAAALASGELDGFCAGEPWHAVAESLGVGRTVVFTSEIWPNHPEKVLACRRDFATRYPHTARALVQTMLEACRWLDEDPLHRASAAKWLAAQDVIGVAPEQIAPRLLGDTGRAGALPVSFFDHGAVNYPRASDGTWFISQYRRWGLFDGPPDDDAAIADAVNQTRLYRDAAAALDIPVSPDADTRIDRLCDGATWPAPPSNDDGVNP